MFIHFYTHDILIFFKNYDKNSLNINVPFAIGPSLNAFNWIFLSNPFLYFVWISNNNTHQRFNNIFHILSFKITKSTLLNQTWWGLSNNIKNAPKFQYNFQSWFFKNFNGKNGSIINRFHTIVPNIINQVGAPLFIENFLMISSIS